MSKCTQVSKVKALIVNNSRVKLLLFLYLGKWGTLKRRKDKWVISWYFVHKRFNWTTDISNIITSNYKCRGLKSTIVFLKSIWVKIESFPKYNYSCTELQRQSSALQWHQSPGVSPKPLTIPHHRPGGSMDVMQGVPVLYYICICTLQWATVGMAVTWDVTITLFNSHNHFWAIVEMLYFQFEKMGPFLIDSNGSPA